MKIGKSNTYQAYTLEYIYIFNNYKNIRMLTETKII